jgi:hypothetical protein
MTTKKNWVSLLCGFAISCIPASAQQYVAVQYVDQARTPIESQLASPDLAMSGLGLSASKAQIAKRLDYAQQNSWLSADQLTQLRAELKQLVEKETSSRDAAGKLPFPARQELSKLICDLNEKFEEQVLIREQSIPGMEGLKARQAMMIQRINKALALGKVAPKKASALRSEVRGTLNGISDTDELTESQSKELVQSLNATSQKLDKELEASSNQVAGRGSFSIRQYDQSNATY